MNKSSVIVRSLHNKYIKTSVRRKNSNSSSSVAKQNYEEIKIPVPWGHIAGKWWGPQERRPVLALHGWQDNCGTFDTLIPHLQFDRGVLAIDLPGHGLSSQLPPGMFYHGVDSVTLIRRLKKYFNWSTISLMGHSMGAIASYMYTVFYPKEVNFLVCFDALFPVGRGVLDIESIVKTTEKFMRYDTLNSELNEPPMYTMKEMKLRMHEGTRKSIDVDSTKYILERNVRPSKTDPSKFFFARDPRLKSGPLLVWSPEFIMQNANRVKCPMIVIKAKQSPLLTKVENLHEVLAEIRRVNEHVHFHAVDGTHHVHLNNPEAITTLVNEFLAKYNVDERKVAEKS